MGIIAWIVLGALAGFIANLIMGSRDGLIMMVVLGIVGAVVGGFIELRAIRAPGRARARRIVNRAGRATDSPPSRREPGRS